jgi:hypothetical protein
MEGAEATSARGARGECDFNAEARRLGDRAEFIKILEDAECPEMGLGSFGISELPGAAGEGSFDVEMPRPPGFSFVLCDLRWRYANPPGAISLTS